MYAKGTRALGICDRCGEQWKHKRLRFQPIAGVLTKLLVCPDCLDEDNPQLVLGRYSTVDAQGIENPRPDLNRGIDYFGWNPVGGLGCQINTQ